MTLRTILQPLAIIALLAIGSGAAYYLLQMEPGQSIDHHHHHDHDHGEHAHNDHDEHDHDTHSHEEEAHAHEGESHDHAHDHDDHHATTIPDEVAHEMGIDVRKVGPQRITEAVKVTGYIEAVPARMVRVSPQYDGVVQELFVEIGQQVKKGDIIATIASRDTGVAFSLKSPLEGTVLAISFRPGEVATEGTSITIGDLTELWAQLHLSNSLFSRVKVGMPVTITTSQGNEDIETTLDYISPLGSAHSQTRTARAVLPNADERWYPGQFITAEIVERAESVPLAVSASALQTLEGQTVVFVKEGRTYEARAVTLGRQDSHFAEITSGLEAGETYVSEHSFLIKADLLKSSAGHDH